MAACGSPSTLTKHRLSKEAETVQSTAAEGATLAAQVARGRTTEPFARIHAHELAEQAKSAGKVLREAQAPGYDPDREKAAHVAGQVEQALERLHAAPGDRELARQLQHELEQDAATAGKVAG